ncbi:hypothetical protein [Bacillus xiapuensis]|uniref:Uncharacterized protein n=1 Tax=Bacillus xiapuensis TaxID=2014075 RepID=A0ABU6NC97_9BACI|nr:hypothetical protein [Bacillus xiapuensis]
MAPLSGKEIDLPSILVQTKVTFRYDLHSGAERIIAEIDGAIAGSV